MDCNASWTGGYLCIGSAYLSGWTTNANPQDETNGLKIRCCYKNILEIMSVAGVTVHNHAVCRLPRSVHGLSRSNTYTFSSTNHSLYSYVALISDLKHLGRERFGDLFEVSNWQGVRFMHGDRLGLSKGLNGGHSVESSESRCLRSVRRQSSGAQFET